jgi:DNA-binding NarL/FixJ family response regulator
VAQALWEEGSSVRVLALSAHADRAYVEGLLRAGAAGYMTKGRDLMQIAEAVRAVARGEGRWFVAPAPPDPLTDREREVLRLLAEGRANAEIADELALSQHTVRNHLASVYAKLGVTTAREAVAWAWAHGLGRRRE